MSLFYEYYYLNYGVRKGEHLITPPLAPLTELQLPRSSIYHYLSDSQVDVGPPSDEYLFRDITRPIMMVNVVEAGDNKGTPRRLAVAPEGEIRAYHIKHRRYRRVVDLRAVARDPLSLIVYNYGVINKLYHYPRSFYSDYYRWWNTQSAVWKTAAQLASQLDRQQFFSCKLPKILPSLADLKVATGGISTRMLKIFDSHEALFLLELWKWVGPERAQSVLATLTDEAVKKINFIFQESGKWFVLNLGMLNEWRQPTDEEIAIHPELKKKKGLEAVLMQRRLLRLMMSLMEVRTAAAALQAPAATPAPVADQAASSVPGQGQATASLPGAPVPEPVVITQPVEVPKPDQNGAVVSKTITTPVPVEARQARPDQKTPADTGEDMMVLDHDFEAQLMADLAELEAISKRQQEAEAEERKAVSLDTKKPVSKAAPERQIQESETLEQGVMKVADRFADNGMLSAAEYRRYDKLAKSYREITVADGTTLDKFIQIDKKVLAIDASSAIKDMPTIVDKTMLKSSLHDFDSRYVKKVMPKDVAAMVLNVQRAGIAVTQYQSERVEDVLGSYDAHTVRVVPVDGAASTFHFKLPTVEEDGTYTANGIKYRMRKQRGDLPIRKIAPDRVALTSYYGKVFVSRSEKKVNDYGTWLCNNVMAMGLDAADTVVTKLHPGNVFDSDLAAPRLYSALAMNFREFCLTPMHLPEVLKGRVAFDLNFDHTKREALYGAEAIKTFEKDGAILVGRSAKDVSYVLVMDKNGMLYIGHQGKLLDIGSMEQLLGLESSKAPVEFAEMKVLGRNIPVAIILGYEIGLEKLMALLHVTSRRVPAGARVNLEDWEYSIVFSDETLVFSKEDREAAIVLAGFNEFHRTIRNYSVYEFDKRGVYLNVLESGGTSTRYLREIDLIYQMFVDPITRDLLIEMKEPTEFRGLLLRSCDMLLVDQHPSELDPAFMRIKGYERMAGAVYSELVKSIRAHNGRVGKSRLPIDLNPYAVWKSISQDPAVAQVSDINPIQNLKETEAVTYSGTGGRSSRSMTKHTRAYHENDMGTISESTVDSSDVAINTYTSADPQFTSLRGMSRRYKIGETGPTALLSTSALVSPGSDRDDPKRVNFIGIQHSHGVACAGYTQMSVRTGYEQVVAHRTSDLFAYTAKKPGKVVSISETGMVVQYNDGETRGIELGRRFGNAAGLVIPHSVKTELKVSQSFKEGDVLCYNDGFFERDLLNPSNVVWKAGMLVKTALMESTQTLEDSSAISERVAKLLTTKITKVKTIVVRFDQSVRKLVKLGDVLDSENILCIIEDAVTANSGLFDEQSLDTLRLLSAQTPQARAKGTVERVEVFYHGDKQDMSESLQLITAASDREMAKRNRSAGKKAYTGSVDEGFRVEGEPLSLDTVAIRVYITSDVPAGVGDKGVFANQMKTVFGEVLAGEVKTESGKAIDAIFGQKSIADRIVLSPELIGTTTVLLDVIGKKALAAYKS